MAGERLDRFTDALGRDAPRRRAEGAGSRHGIGRARESLGGCPVETRLSLPSGRGSPVGVAAPAVDLVDREPQDELSSPHLSTAAPHQLRWRLFPRLILLWPGESATPRPSVRVWGPSKAGRMAVVESGPAAGSDGRFTPRQPTLAQPPFQRLSSPFSDSSTYVSAMSDHLREPRRLYHWYVQ